jgi:uncharacterized protein (TIGR03085 family)
MPGVTNWARAERRQLAELMVDMGADAPTLCEGWSVRDLAAHLVVRERRPDAAAGIVVSALAAHGEAVRSAMASRPWSQLVDLVRAGPPRWNPTSLDPVDELVNTVEFAVHHEDVRRAQPAWAPRLLPAEFEQELWRRLKQSARLASRRSPTGLVLRTPSGDEVVARKGTPAVTVNGAPLELLVFAFGRQAHSVVEVQGPETAVAEVRAARLGM